MDSEALNRTLRRMATEIVEATATSLPIIVGVRRGGVVLAEQLVHFIKTREGVDALFGTVDIALYRDDAATALPDPKIGPSQIPVDLLGRDVVLVDDVLQTGRTIRAAIDCLMDYGRPARVWLAVLIDRGGRELPIAADFIGKQVEIPSNAKIRVSFGEGLQGASVETTRE